MYSRISAVNAFQSSKYTFQTTEGSLNDAACAAVHGIKFDSVAVRCPLSRYGTRRLGSSG